MGLQSLAVLVLVASVVLAAAALAVSRDGIQVMLPKRWVVHLNGYRFGYRVDYSVRIPMRDEVKLAASLYRPTGSQDKLATVLVRLPYDRLVYSEGLWAAEYFARNGYAVLVQDIRGTHASEGRFEPYRHGTNDGVDTLDWIASQPWSNGKVGTFGCSSLGETQHLLARARHPAHAAMVPIGAGGAIGSAGGRYGYFGLFEGGVFQLASGFGWFSEHGSPDPKAPRLQAIDTAAALNQLPVGGLVQRVRPGPNAYDDFVRRPLTDPWWKGLDYLSDEDLFATPELVITTWGDQTLGDTLALAELSRHGAPPSFAQHVVIAPGTHCHNQESGDSGEFGDLRVPGASKPYMSWALEWFDHWLRGRGPGLRQMPAYLFYMTGESRWLESSAWPPPDTHVERWHLSSAGHANGRSGNGRVDRNEPVAAGSDSFLYDPMKPVPSRGGPVCCTGNPADRAGPVDQRDVESREDVLVFTSDPLVRPLRIAGPLRATLTISSSALDTDFVARLVDVGPDGRAIGIQEGALRARYRRGTDRPTLLEPGTPVQLTIDMRSVGHTLAKGHRIRIHVTSSSFPRLERNLNTGGRNWDESEGTVATNTLHYGAGSPSFVEMRVLPSP